MATNLLNLKTLSAVAVAGALTAGTIAFIKHEEGLKTDAYKDAGGVLTICYGETRTQYTSQGHISALKCEEILRTRLQNDYAKPIVECLSKKGVGNVPTSVLMALTSFAYNVGTGRVCNNYNQSGGSTVGSAVEQAAKSDDWSKVCNSLADFVTINGQVRTDQGGLFKRRTTEYLLCMRDLGIEPTINAGKGHLAKRADMWNQGVDLAKQYFNVTNAQKSNGQTSSKEYVGEENFSTGNNSGTGDGTVVYNGTTTTTGGTSGTSGNINYSSTNGNVNVGSNTGQNMVNSGGVGETTDFWRYNLDTKTSDDSGISSYGGVTTTDKSHTFNFMVSANKNFKEVLNKEYGEELNNVLGDAAYKELENYSCLYDLKNTISGAFIVPNNIMQTFLQNLNQWACNIAEQAKTQARQAVQNSLGQIQSQLQQISTPLGSAIDGSNPIGKTINQTIDGVQFNINNSATIPKVPQGSTDKNIAPFDKEKQLQNIQQSQGQSSNNSQQQLNQNLYY